MRTLHWKWNFLAGYLYRVGLCFPNNASCSIDVCLRVHLVCEKSSAFFIRFLCIAFLTFSFSLGSKSIAHSHTYTQININWQLVWRRFSFSVVTSASGVNDADCFSFKVILNRFWIRNLFCEKRIESIYTVIIKLKVYECEFACFTAWGSQLSIFISFFLSSPYNALVKKEKNTLFVLEIPGIVFDFFSVIRFFAHFLSSRMNETEKIKHIIWILNYIEHLCNIVFGIISVSIEDVQLLRCYFCCCYRCCFCSVNAWSGWCSVVFDTD